MPSAGFQQTHKDGSKANRPLSAPGAKKGTQHVTFAVKHTAPHHLHGDQISGQVKHAPVKDSCTQWNQDDSWKAQHLARAASRKAATSTVTGGYSAQTHKLEEASLLLWYTKTFSKSEREMLASWARKNSLAPMPDYVPPPETATKQRPPAILCKEPLAKNDKTWQ